MKHDFLCKLIFIWSFANFLFFLCNNHINVCHEMIFNFKAICIIYTITLIKSFWVEYLMLQPGNTDLLIGRSIDVKLTLLGGSWLIFFLIFEYLMLSPSIGQYSLIQFKLPNNIIFNSHQSSTVELSYNELCLTINICLL